MLRKNSCSTALKQKKLKQYTDWNIEYYKYLIPVLFLTFLLFIRTSQHEFVNWDDQDMVTNNIQIRSLTSENLTQMIIPSSSMNEYQPLTTFFYAIIYHFFELNPAPYFIFNLIFHLLNIILVFYLIILLCKKKIIAFFVSILFAVHPLQVEVVAWASASNYLIFSFFFLLSSVYYLKYILSDYRRKYIIYAVVFFILSLFTKATAVVLPLVLLTFDYYLKRKFEWKLIFEKVPFFLLSLIFGIIALIPKAENQVVITLAENFNFIDRLFFGFYSFSFYVIKLIIPFSQKLIYLYPEKTNNLLPFIFYIAPIFVFLIIYALSLIKSWSSVLIFGCLFLISNIIFVLHFIPFFHVGIVAERYTYLGSIGVFFIIAYLVFHLLNKYSEKSTLIYTSLIFYLGFLLISTHFRINTWSDSLTLWSQEVKVNPNNALAYANRGEALYLLEDFESAISDFDMAISLNPNFFEAYNNRGIAKKETGDYSGAIDDYKMASNINPNYAEAFFNRGSIRGEMGDDSMAIANYSKSIEINPNYSDAYYSRGNIFSKIGKVDEAIADYNTAIETDPMNIEAFNNRGISYAKLKQYDAAMADFSRSIEINSNFSDAYVNLGILHIELNRKNEACRNFSIAQDLGSQFASDLMLKYCK
ncbi:MAG: tetratricopeptide repeat protein [Bacteroidales bacterium]|nr:tetratricopeptide repeat protein [Bacteroidales bacterium]